MTMLKLGDGFPKIHPELAPQVKELQGLLRAWGYNISESGRFDWETDGAVIHFQKEMHLKVDGKVQVGGGKTWPALKKPLPAVLPGRSYSADMSYPVPFINQFDTIHVKGAGQEGCFAASETMLRAMGVKQAGPANQFRIIKKETWEKNVPTHEIDDAALKSGIAYLDAQLAKDVPVMVGVSYAAGSYNEGITEHFVVIYERVGEGVYHFHDPATNYMARGAGRTFIKDATAKTLTADGVSEASGVLQLRYYVTFIRKNEE